jgi:hypothetical protein
MTEAAERCDICPEQFSTFRPAKWIFYIFTALKKHNTKQMITIKNFTAFALLLAGGMLATGCAGSKEDEKPDYEITNDSMSDKSKADINMIRVSIPSPSDLTTGMANAKIKYSKELMNPASKSGSYSSNFQKAAVMGIYGADLGYAASYNQSQDLIEYFGAVSKMAKDLGLESAFDESLVGRIKDNIGKKDSLVDLVDDAYDKAERNLRSNQRVSTAALITSGGWIEGIYLSSSAIKDAGRDTSNAVVYDRTWSHVNSFKSVIDLLTEYKSNADCAKMLEMLKDFQPYVDKTNRSGGGVLSKEDAAGIYTKISEIRSKIVN